MSENTFAKFTNLYELSKTLRFELKPVGEIIENDLFIWDKNFKWKNLTEYYLEKNQVFQTDKIRQKKYEEIKPFLDEFHLDFIKFCLLNLNLDYTEYKKSLDIYQKDKKNKDLENKKENEEKRLREKIAENFDSKVLDFLKTFWEVEIIKWKKDNNKIKVILWKDWEIEFSKNNHEFLFEIWIFDLMKKKFEKRWDIYLTDKETWEIYKNKKTWKDITIFDDWNWWLGYLTKFFETRKNLYKSDGTSTALATRIIDENLKKYCNNLDIYNRLFQIEELKNKFQNLEADFWIKLEKFFSLENYNSCILQGWIQQYNDVRWWKVIEKNKKIPWINEYINKYRQDSWEKIPYLQKLDKQILFWLKEDFIKQIENEPAFEKILSNFYDNSIKKVEILTQIFENLRNYIDDDYKTIYFSKEAFNTISHKFTDHVLVFEELVFNELLKDKLVEKKDFDKKEEKYKFPDFIPLFFVKKGLENYLNSEKWKNKELFFKSRYYIKDLNELKEMNNEVKKVYEKIALKLEQSNDYIWIKFCTILNYEFQTLLSNIVINQNWEEIEIWFNFSKNKLYKILDNFSLWENNNWIIKDFADISKTIYQMWKYFALEKKREWNNNFELNDDFYKTEYSEENKKYGYLEFYNEAYEQIIDPYNLMRNFIAKKPWEDNKKWKLNFDHKKLLWWFTESKTDKSDNWTQYWAYLFRQKSEDWKFLYLLWVSKNAKLFRKDYIPLDNDTLSNLERLNYFQILPKSIYGALYQWNFDSDKKNLSDWEIIKKVKNALKNYTNIKVFKEIVENWKYKVLKDIQKDINEAIINYWTILKYQNITNNQIKEAKQSNNPFYLFKIHSQDLYLENSNKNLHSLYFKEILKWKNTIFNLWNWEIFFRPKTEIGKLWKKKDKSWKEVTNHKRYSEDKIIFHLSTVVNNWSEQVPQKEWAKKAFNFRFNQNINSFLSNNPNINIIWIDRWEKHLAYYSVINQKQEIIESWSLNYICQKYKDGNIIQKTEKKIKEVKNEEWKIIDYELIEVKSDTKTWKLDYEDYWVLLEFKEKKRRLQRQSWKEVEQIKDLKKGYISAVVRKIADLIIEHNAIVVFEDLNMRFKQIRGWIEKSVYQQLEKALIDKLNFLVNKWEVNPEKAWNLLKAFQLTAPIWTFKDMWKQTWIIFYTQASYTSKIDPLTWWRPNLYIKKQSAELNKVNILKFDSILWNKQKETFEITYDLEKFQSENTKNQKEEKLEKTKWTLLTCIERYKWNKNLNNNKWWYDYFENLTNEFKELFEKYGINIEKNILEQIKQLDEKWNEKFFSQFLDLFKLLCQIRNTNKDEKWDENDFIYSPVYPFFDSRKENKIWVKNWDDNWAYNIARKWVIILKKISEWKKENDEKRKKWEKEISYPDLFISNISWDNFTQKNK